MEIIMAVEDHFGIDVEDDALAKVSTVGDLRDVVVAKLEEGRSRRTTIHMATFHRVRRALMKAFCCSRSALRPEARLEALIPVERRAAWSKLSAELPARIPGLERPPGVQMGLHLAWGMPAVVGVVSSLACGGRWQHAVAGFGAGLVAGGVVSCATLRQATRIPRKCETVSDLVNTVIRIERKRLGHAHVSPTPDLVLEGIISIAAEHLGMERDRIHAGSLWVEDLGVGCCPPGMR